MSICIRLRAHIHHKTAFSQHRNLLFVAYSEVICVYTPSFPDQIITASPKLIITLETSRPGLTGFIDPRRPHAVNHLIVGDIGDEEVLVVACDDGDVISYTVRSISLAIDEGFIVCGPTPEYGIRKIAQDMQDGWINMLLPILNRGRRSAYRILTPWFIENVGASAWGLATHKRAMLLAVSSNTKCIDVFAPALSPEKDEIPRQKYRYPERIERFTAWEGKGSTPIRDRSLGMKVTLQGHSANIPNVAFCDNSLDPEGRYLASTDIDGYTFVWDIWRGGRVTAIVGSHGARKLNINITSRSFSVNEPDTLGWAVACLDPQASRLRYVIQGLRQPLK